MSVIQFDLNGHPVTVNAEPDRLLLWTLRGELQLTGTKYGCGSGICGACTVLLDGQAARACVTSLAHVQGRSVVTIEGLAGGGALHPLQQAFIDHGALQCGYCTPGMIMNARALLLAKPHPSRAEIAEAMEHNLCRCGAHQRILDAVEAAVRAGPVGS
jgi:aerobic-type carbon monoxide dehydrogenase small subunit (CoxS/CutS family)